MRSKPPIAYSLSAETAPEASSARRPVSTIEARGVPDAGSGLERTTFEARLRLLPAR